MGRIAFALAFLLPLAALAEQPAMDGIPEGDIVMPHLHRHVIGAPDSAKAAPDPAPELASSDVHARTRVRSKKKKVKRWHRRPRVAVRHRRRRKADDVSMLVPDLPSGDDASASDGRDAAARVAALAGSDAKTAPAAPQDDFAAEPDIALPTRRPVVNAPEPQAAAPETTTDTVEAREPDAPSSADFQPPPDDTTLPEASPVPAAALSDGPQPMRNLRLGIGLAMVGLMGANLALTQLDHSDHFLGSDTGRFAAAHHDTEYATFGGMGVLSLVEVLSEDSHSTLHKIGFVTAVVATAAQAGLLFATDARVGDVDQLNYSRAHLAASWTATAALAVSSVALAF